MSGTSGTFSDTRSQARRASSKLVVYDSLSRASDATLAAGTEGEESPLQPLGGRGGVPCDVLLRDGAVRLLTAVQGLLRDVQNGDLEPAKRGLHRDLGSQRPRSHHAHALNSARLRRKGGEVAAVDRGRDLGHCNGGSVQQDRRPRTKHAHHHHRRHQRRLYRNALTSPRPRPFRVVVSEYLKKARFEN